MLRAALEGIQPVGLCQAQRWLKKKTLGGGFKWAWVEIYDPRPRTIDFILCLVSTIWLWGTLFWPRPYPTVFRFQLHMEWWSQVTFRLFRREGAKQNHQMWVRSPWYHQITSYYILNFRDSYEYPHEYPIIPQFLLVKSWWIPSFAGDLAATHFTGPHCERGVKAGHGERTTRDGGNPLIQYSWYYMYINYLWYKLKYIIWYMYILYDIVLMI